MNKYLIALIMLITLSQGFDSHAQTNSSDPQTVCVGYSGAYQVDYLENGGEGTIGSNYTWSVITAGFSGTIIPFQGPNARSNRALINWENTPPGTYQVQVIETNASCQSSPVLLNVQLIPTVTPAFPPIGPLCQNSIAPALPSTSTNGVTGTWSPASISTATVGTASYTFTPDAGQCAAPVTITIDITNQIVPAFTAIAPLCQNSAAPTLPTTSTNGITGTWSPATISTATAGNTVYTFTPNAGQCAAPATLSVNVTATVLPLFTAVGPYCQNAIVPALPATSINGINGTWSPAAISNTILGTTVYTFTPAVGLCASQSQLNVTINALPSTSPIFHD